MTEREFLSKRHFVRDEVVPGYNDGCRVIHTSRQREQSGEAYRTCLKLLGQMAAINRKLTALEARDSSMDRLDRAIAALDRQRYAPIPDAPNAGPTVNQMMQQYYGDFMANQDRICRESEAAYAARNPHKKEGN